MSDANARRIFVFGSNPQGRHGKGAALEARTNWGAIYGVPKGLQGNSYAIVTKELRSGHPRVTLQDVAQGVARFVDFANSHPEVEFLVSPIGCGLAGFQHKEIGELFLGAPSNVRLPKEFMQALDF